MSTQERPDDARMSLRLPRALKRAIEEAAILSGQSVDEFAVATLVHAARETIEREAVTRLSDRDRDILRSLLDDPNVRPNDALTAATVNYLGHRQ
jgi:uncharacterized protein (DUF1778 family)